MTKNSIRWLCGALIALFLASCNSRLPYSNLTRSSSYGEQSKFMMSFTSAYHVSDSVSRIWFSVPSAGLLYVKGEKGTTFCAKYRTSWQVYPYDEPNVLQDSGSRNYVDSSGYLKNIIFTDSIDACRLSHKIYAVHITIKDLNKNQEYKTMITLMRDDEVNRQNFRVWADNKVITGNVAQQQQNMRLKYNNKSVNRLYVRLYRNDYPLALPPFVENRDPTYSLKPDSVFFLDLDNGLSSTFRCKKNSICHFQADTTQKEGLTLFTFYDGFPAITTAEQMLAPIRYISTKSEFNDLKILKNPKQAVDEFWLGRAGNVERAKDMIARYYSRVQDANKYFTSYLEGWKTDRGMIYIVFGPPNAMYSSVSQETWVYGEDRNILSTTFTFNKVENPFTDNDYSLERSAEFKDTWYTAVEAWRR